MKFRIKTNLWTGIVMGLFSIFLLISLPSQIAEPAYDSGAPSPRLLPGFYVVVILICSVILIIESLVFKKETYFDFDWKQEKPMILLILLMVAFTVMTVYLGFVVAFIITFVIMLFYMGERKPPIYIFSICVGIGIYLLFKYVFNITLPSFPGFGG